MLDVFEKVEGEKYTGHCNILYLLMLILANTIVKGVQLTVGSRKHFHIFLLEFPLGN